LFLNAADFHLFGFNLIEQMQRRLTGCVGGRLLAQFLQVAFALGQLPLQGHPLINQVGIWLL
jgi:hypothetical protein